MNRITSLFGIQYPIIQGGMVWCSGWRLASAVSNAGGLGLLGAGSMHPEMLREHISKCHAATHNPFGVNIPLMYPHSSRSMYNHSYCCNHLRNMSHYSNCVFRRHFHPSRPYNC